MTPPAQLPRKPEARSEKVEDLVDRVLRGSLRIPRFQRGLKWTATEVRELFDSLYRGYPVGSLLFFKRPASAARLTLGPLEVDAPELSEAWWVVDGQQRLTSLAACLARPTPIPVKPRREDPYVLYFDAGEQTFRPPPGEPIPRRWVPLPSLLDASRLAEWVYRWHHRENDDLRRIVFEAGTRLREYPIPLYLIESDDDEVPREIFYRVNKAGKPLEWTEIHTALFGSEDGHPSTLSELADELIGVGMGRLDEKRVLTALIASRGQDPTRTLAEHVSRDRDVLSGAVGEALPVLRRVLSFLRRDAGIPHLRLLPKSILLDVLSRFFAVHPDPNPRTRLLLARWFWRTVLGAARFDDRTTRRSGIKAVVEDPEESAQALLELVQRGRPRPASLASRFDPRSDASRIALLALAHLGPRDLETGERIDVTGLIEGSDKLAFPAVVQAPGSLAGGPANRLVHPRGRRTRDLLVERIAARGAEDRALASHAISAAAAERLHAGDDLAFLEARAAAVLEEIRRFGERRADWDHSDRPSVDHLLSEVGVELE